MARMGRYTTEKTAEAQNPVPPVRQIAAHAQNANDAQGRKERGGRGEEEDQKATRQGPIFISWMLP